MAHAAERGGVWIKCWRDAVSVVGCQCRIVGIVHFPFVTRIRLPKKSNKCDKKGTGREKIDGVMSGTKCN